LNHASSLAAAGRWFQQSGIQERSGGVARYYLQEAGQNRAVSTEITGYAASAQSYLARTTGNAEFLESAARAARFLCEKAWQPEPGIFPFELEEPLYAYFFDTGIIIRGLLAVWKETREAGLLQTAVTAAKKMTQHFAGAGDWHPILRLPSLEPVPRETRWSRESACYQLKSALAWLNIAEITGDPSIAIPYYDWLQKAAAAHRDYLPGSDDPHVVMDRLHPYCYFLEGMSPFVSDYREEYAWGLDRAGQLLREVRPQFLRADVCAQLLRARLLAAPVVPVNYAAAEEEAAELESFQAQSDDPRVDGGFWFGRRNDQLIPHLSPVPTAFAIQALDMWDAYQAGQPPRALPLI
jgi:hypothetical protein